MNTFVTNVQPGGSLFDPTVTVNLLHDAPVVPNQALGYAVSVPGPIVGAGLPGLMAACGALLALARRRRQLVA